MARGTLILVCPDRALQEGRSVYAHLSHSGASSVFNTRRTFSQGLWNDRQVDGFSQKEFTLICSQGYSGEKGIWGEGHWRVEPDPIWKHNTYTEAEIVLLILGSQLQSELKTFQLRKAIWLKSLWPLISSFYHPWGPSPHSRWGLLDLANKNTDLQLHLNFR